MAKNKWLPGKSKKRHLWAGLAAASGVGIVVSSFVPGGGLLSPVFKGAALLALGGAGAQGVEERRKAREQAQRMIHDICEEARQSDLPGKPASRITDYDKARLSFFSDDDMVFLSSGHKVEAIKAQILLDVSAAKDMGVTVPPAVLACLRSDDQKAPSKKSIDALKLQRETLRQTLDEALTSRGFSMEVLKDFRGVLRLGALEAGEFAVKYTLKHLYRPLGLVFSLAEGAEVMRSSLRHMRGTESEVRESANAMISEAAARISRERRLIALTQKTPSPKAS